MGVNLGGRQRQIQESLGGGMAKNCKYRYLYIRHASHLK